MNTSNKINSHHFFASKVTISKETFLRKKVHIEQIKITQIKQIEDKYKRSSYSHSPCFLPLPLPLPVLLQLHYGMVESIQQLVRLVMRKNVDVYVFPCLFAFQSENNHFIHIFLPYHISFPSPYTQTSIFSLHFVVQWQISMEIENMKHPSDEMSAFKICESKIALFMVDICNFGISWKIIMIDWVRITRGRLDKRCLLECYLMVV